MADDLRWFETYNDYPPLLVRALKKLFPATIGEYSSSAYLCGYKDAMDDLRESLGPQKFSKVQRDIAKKHWNSLTSKMEIENGPGSD